MSTLVYTPKAEVHISTVNNGIVDVTDDIQSGRVTRLTSGVSTLNFQLLNQSRKYDGMFTSMDRVVCYLTRTRRLLVFSGYLNRVPTFTTYPMSVPLSASCTLKRLQYFLWDPDSPAAVRLFDNEFVNLGGGDWPQDGGSAKRTIDLLNKVAGWPVEQIHIGRVPIQWFKQIRSLADALVAESDANTLAGVVGSMGFLNGTNPFDQALTSVQGDGAGTGTLPNTSGRISAFAGKGTNDATGRMALTGEPGTNPSDIFYCAMRWPYRNPDGSPAHGVNETRAIAWWKNRRIIAVNPENHKAVCLRAADWGPALFTHRVLDMSPEMCQYLGGTDSNVHIAFAPANTPLGPIRGTVLGQILGGQGIGDPGPIDAGWRVSTADETWVTAQGCRFQVNKMAASKFVGFVNDLANTLGYHPKSISGYNVRNIAGTGDLSNHAYGAAIDIDPTKNPRYGTAAGGPYALPKPPAIINLARKWGLGWGGEYTNSKDYMHFEVLGAPASTAKAYKDNPGGTGPVVVNKWVPPFKDFTISTHYGEAGSHWASGYHSGTDFVASGGAGTDIHPVGPGTVDFAGTDADYGNCIGIFHGNGVYTFYAHMLHPSPLQSGDTVTVDSVLGQMGETGNAFGAHTHVELRLDADTYDASGQGLPANKRKNDIEPYLVGGPNRPDPPRGVTGSDIGGTGGGGSGTGGGNDMANIGGSLLNLLIWQQVATDEGTLLSGKRALMNDVPILGTVQELTSYGLRDFCSAPNGDFIAWFPDYFGLYNMAGKMVISDIEIDAQDGLVIYHDDTFLKTHQFVTGSSTWQGNDAARVEQEMQTAGIATVEEPVLMAALFNLDPKDIEQNFGHQGADFLNRYGPRVDHQEMNSISGARQEFFFACYRFQQNWTQQWQTQVAITFMPEMWPGMLACFPRYGLQGYVDQVDHSWDLSDGGSGFTTTISCKAWSTMGKDKGPSGFPIGAPL